MESAMQEYDRRMRRYQQLLHEINVSTEQLNSPTPDLDDGYDF